MASNDIVRYAVVSATDPGRMRYPGLSYLTMISIYDNTNGSISQDFSLHSIERHIRHHAAHTTVVGLTLMCRLTQHDDEVSPATLCPLPHELEHADFLACEDRIVPGHAASRRYSSYARCPLDMRR
jgi:hypothetical protein